MQIVAMRDLQQKGLKALLHVKDEPVLVQNRSGVNYFLVPAQQADLDAEYRELVRAMALANLRKWQLRSQELGLDQMTDEEINAEVAKARKARRRKAVT